MIEFGNSIIVANRQNVVLGIATTVWAACAINGVLGTKRLLSGHNWLFPPIAIDFDLEVALQPYHVIRIISQP